MLPKGQFVNGEPSILGCRLILTDVLQVLGEEQIFQNEGWYMRRTVQMECGGFHLKAKHSMDVRSGVCESCSCNQGGGFIQQKLVPWLGHHVN